MDPMTASALISGGSSLLGGLFGNNSAKKAAKAQMEFQERMARNAHQYEVADLRAAGLNPILSATGGSGAATPSGAKAEVWDPITPAVNSALAAKLQQSQIDLNKASAVSAVETAAKTSADAAIPKTIQKVVEGNIQPVVERGVNAAKRVSEVPGAVKDIAKYFTSGGKLSDLAIEAGILNAPTSAKSVPPPRPPRVHQRAPRFKTARNPSGR